MPLLGKSFLAHQGKERTAVLEDVLKRVRAKQWRIGASIFLPRYMPATGTQNAKLFDAQALYVLADPETRRMIVPFAKRGRGHRQHPYLAQNHAVNRARFVKEVLEAQVANGRSVLISPALIHGLTGQPRELDLTIEYAKLAHGNSLATNRTVLFSVEATAHIFADDVARNDMLDKIVELPERPIYLRMTCSGQPSRGGYANQRALRGLRAVVESLAGNDRPVFLVQSGLAGWLMLPFGAVAFGAGISSSLQRCTSPDGGGGGGGNAPLAWYFAPSLLSFVLAPELVALRAVSGWSECTCPYCAAVPPDARHFNAQTAGQHFLWWCALLANETNGSDPVGSVRNRLRDALQFWQEVREAEVQLDPRSMPMHLAVWSAVVA